MAKSTKSRRSRKSRLNWDKPEKPYEGYPLNPHPTGRWYKKIGGRFHYFGPLSDPQAALDEFNRQWPYLSQGLPVPPRDAGDGCTFADLCESFMASKLNKLESGELSMMSFDDYYRTCRMLLDHFGRDRRVDSLRPDDFERLRAKLAQRFGVVTLKNEINRCRIVLKYASDQQLIDRPVNYGQSFDRPSAKTMRKARNAAGLRMFEAEEIRRILDALDGKPVRVEGNSEPVKLKADPILKPMVMLGVNCGFGNTDIASLPQSAVNLDTGWIDFPRPKTEIHRRVPLWPETLAALREAIARRPAPGDSTDVDLCFLTIQGNRFVRTKPSQKSEGKYVTVNTLAHRFGALLKTLKINGRRGLGFYTLRHVFETIAGESKDQVAVNAIMGHVDNSMACLYRERISDERLRAVTETVRRWLWADAGTN